MTHAPKSQAELRRAAAELHERHALHVEGYKRRLEALRASCTHPPSALVELVDTAGEPLRACTTCGAEEGGWGCGYRVLVTDPPYGPGVPTVSRDEFFSHRHPVGGRYFFS